MQDRRPENQRAGVSVTGISSHLLQLNYGVREKEENTEYTHKVVSLNLLLEIKS